MRNVALMLAALWLAGCATQPRPVTDWDRARQHVERLGNALDAVARHHEEFGAITLSQPLLVKPDQSPAFALTSGGAESHYTAAKTQIQGAAGFFDQSVLSAGVAAKVLVDPTQEAAYLEKVLQYQSDRARIDRKAALKDAAAQDEYNAAVEAAMKKESPEREKALADAKRALADGLIGPSTATPAFPTSKDVDAPADKTVTATAPDAQKLNLAEDKFQKFRNLIDKKEPSTSNRAALITAAGDTTVEAIFKALGQPDRALAFKGKHVALGVGMVSVNPGWRTRKGYAAELIASMDFHYVDARPQLVTQLLAGLPECEKQYGDWRLSPECACAVKKARPDLILAEDRFKEEPTKPSVAAVSPMTETQTLDLAASERRRNELSLALAFALTSAGMKAEADSFLKYVRQREKDIATRTVDVPVSAFSAGNTIGYQVGPMLRAIDDVRASKAAPDFVLQRQTFPVLLMFAFDSADILPYVVAVPNDKGTIDYVVREPYLRMTHSNRWIPLTPDSASRRATEKAVLLNAIGLREAQAQIETIRDEAAADALEKVKALSDVRGNGLRTLVNGAQFKSPLPLEFVAAARPSDAAAVITKALPEEVVLRRDVDGNVIESEKPLTFVGAGLDNLVPESLQVISGDLAAVTIASVTPGAVSVKAKIRSDKGPIVIAFRDRRPARSVDPLVLAPKIDVSAPFAVRPVVIRQVFPDKVELQKDSGGAVQPRTVKLTFLGDALDRVDLSAVTLLTGSGRITGTARLVGEGSRGGGGGLQVEVRIDNADEPVSLALDVKAAADTPKSTIVSPPVSIQVK